MHSGGNKYASAADFLLRFLASGPKDYAVVKERARAYGYGQRELRDARRELKVKTYNLGNGIYYWGLSWSKLPSV